MAGGRYPIPGDECEHEIEVHRSRFRANVAPAASVEDARAYVQRIRDRHPDATHHGWAFLVGPPGSSDRVGMSDDGEPHGTAGRPMLQVLSHAGVGDAVVVVTRWYGGTKLGTGGLVRAFSDAVRDVLARMTRTERIEWAGLEIVLDYAGIDRLRRVLPAYEATVVDETFADRVTLTVRLPREQVDAFTARVVDLSKGKASILGKTGRAPAGDSG